MSCWLCQVGYGQDVWCGTFCLVTNFLLHWSYSILLFFFFSFSHSYVRQSSQYSQTEKAGCFFYLLEKERVDLSGFYGICIINTATWLSLPMVWGIRGRTNLVDVWWRKHKVHWIKTPTVGSSPEFSHLWCLSWTTIEFVPHIIYHAGMKHNCASCNPAKLCSHSALHS